MFQFSFFFVKFQGDLQKRILELRLQPSSQKASKLLEESIGAHYMGARAVARPETVLPPSCITKMFENPLFLSLPFWRAARAQLRARP